MSDEVTRESRSGRVTGGSIRKVGRANVVRHVSRKVKRLLEKMYPEDENRGEMLPYAVAAEIMMGKENAPADRFKASAFLAERMHGKAPQAIEISGPDGAPVQTESQVMHHVPQHERIADVLKTLSVMAQHGRINVPCGTEGVGEEPSPGDTGGT